MRWLSSETATIQITLFAKTKFAAQRDVALNTKICRKLYRDIDHKNNISNACKLAIYTIADDELPSRCPLHVKFIVQRTL